MSMPALLSHFGINTARFVTSTGEIIFDGVTKVGAGFIHPVHGAVSPIATHTFHGGEESSDEAQDNEAQDNPTVWWDDEDQVHRHVEAMETAFPNFAYVPPEGGSGPCWVGMIDTGRGKFKVGIYLRRDQGLPRVTVFNRRLGMPAGRWWQPAPHVYVNGNLCVADADDWHSVEHTAATVTAWAAHWLAAYTEWRMSRRWPAEGVGVVAS